MKPTSLLQPTVFLMVGMPGAGKSYFARRFGEQHEAPCVSADRLRLEMFNQPQYTPAEQAIVNRVADYMVEELFKTKRSFIIDGLMGNVRSQRTALAQRARAHGFKLLTVWVQVDETTARSRSLKRNAKKVDDRYNPPMPETSFTGLLKQLTPPASEPHVVISGKHNFPTQKAAVLRKLPRPRSAEAPVKPAPQSEQAAPQAPQTPDTIVHTPSRGTGKPSHSYGERTQRPPEKRGIPVQGD